MPTGTCQLPPPDASSAASGGTLASHGQEPSGPAITNDEIGRRRAAAFLALAAVVGWFGLVTEATAQGSAAADRTALVAFYDATGGANWENSRNWKTTLPLGQWYGVQTNASGRVEVLNLEENGLNGPLPTALGNLTHVRQLSLSGNGLTSTIPAALRTPSQLESLGFGGNDLTGAVPTWLGDLSNLRRLSRWGNGLTGTIPTSLRNLDKLELLNLGGNDLTGAVPTWLGDLSNLWRLSLSRNGLTGTIPTSLQNLDKLDSLELGGNDLTGSVPTWLGDLSNLSWLSLSPNGLTGTIPTSLRNLDKLELLNLGGNDLTGAVPTWLGDLSNLWFLSLSRNGLTGTIPTSLRNLDKLESLDLGGNDLTGAVPSWLGDLSNLSRLSLWGKRLGDLRNLSRLSLWENGLTGTIPTSLRNLDKLELLNLGGNDLTGAVPTWLGDLSNLRRLSLWENGLTGTIPTSLRNLDKLESLDLGGNDLTGAVPTWLGDLSNLSWLSLSQNELTGTVPAALGRLQHLEVLSVRRNPLTGILPQQLMQLSQLTSLNIDATAVCAPADDPFRAWLAGIEFIGETCNRAPAAADPIPAQTLTVPESRGVSMAAYFTDPDDDELVYAAESTPSAQVTAIVSGDTVWLSPREAGEVTVAVTACDPGSLCADQTMRVTVQAATTASQSDREVLEALYDATRGAGWTEDTNWKTTAPLESWHGVTIGPSGRVTGLDLTRNGLTGTIPAALQNLDELTGLWLGGNSLAGPIPTWLGDLSNLRGLALYENELAGPVPAALGNLRDLRVLDLCCNELTGSIPVALRNLGNLGVLSFGWNALIGPIPTWLTNLGNLRGLWLGGNELTGRLPAGLGSLSGLRWLALGPNNLAQGPIPVELGDLIHLESLWLGGANRSGPIPPELGNLTNLRVLSLSGNGLSGAIPDELDRLTSLSHLYLAGNFGLSGPLPPEWQLPDLEDLDIFLTQACAPDGWQEQLESIEFQGTICGVEEQNRTVDVAVVYTPPAREAAGGTEAIEAGIDLMIAATNAAFEDSGVRTRVALVARSELSYSETGESGKDLFRLIDPSDGHMDEVHGMRDRVGADLVHLIVREAGADVGGKAQVRGVFGLSVWPGWAVPHELGHNLGLRHDRYWVSTSRRLRPHPAYGYVNSAALQERAPRSNEWRTIMAYPDQCRDRFTYCTWLPLYSNPRQRYNGDPIGVPFDAEADGSDVTGPADAAAVLDVTGPAVAAWRDRPLGADQPAAAAPAFPASSDPLSLRRRLVFIDFQQLGSTVNELTLNLFDDAVFTGLVERTAPTFSGGYALSGRLAGVELGTVTMVVNGDVVAGMVWTPEATYRISAARGGLHAIRQVDRSRLPPLGDPLPRRLPEGDRRDPPRRR